MLIPETLGLELSFEGALVDVLKNVLEAAIILLHDRVLGAQVQRVVALEGILEARLSEARDGGIGVVHAHEDARVLELVSLHHGRGRVDVLRLEGHDEIASLLGNEVSGAVLVTESVSANDDRLGPAGHEARNVFDDDGLAEDGAVKLIADRTIRGFPHLLKVEFLDTSLVRSDRRALDANSAGLDGIGGVKGHLIVRRIAVFHAQIEILDVKVKVRRDKLVLDILPDDTGHLITIKLHNWVSNSDLLHFNFSVELFYV